MSTDIISKVVVLVVDGLTPRAVRLLVVAGVIALGYGWWLHQASIASQEGEVKGLRSDVKAVLQRTDENNAELKTIRQWLMTRPLEEQRKR